MNNASQPNFSWLRHMKVGRSYVRYYDTRRLLHSAQSSIHKFNKGHGMKEDIFLKTQTKVLKRTTHGGTDKVYKLSVTCMSNKNNSTADEKERTW